MKALQSSVKTFQVCMYLTGGMCQHCFKWPHLSERFALLLYPDVSSSSPLDRGMFFFPIILPCSCLQPAHRPCWWTWLGSSCARLLCCRVILSPSRCKIIHHTRVAVSELIAILSTSHAEPALQRSMDYPLTLIHPAFFLCWSESSLTVLEIVPFIFSIGDTDLL